MPLTGLAYGPYHRVKSIQITACVKLENSPNDGVKEQLFSRALPTRSSKILPELFYKIFPNELETFLKMNYIQFRGLSENEERIRSSNLHLITYKC